MANFILSYREMSRGLVKEEDQEEIPMVPPRADLPVGAVNYVTKNGFNMINSFKF